MERILKRSALVAAVMLAVLLATGRGRPWERGAVAQEPAQPMPRAATREDAKVHLRVLQVGIQQSDQTLRDLESRASKLRDGMEQLAAQVQQVRPKPSRKEEPLKPKPVRQERYRPPMERIVEKERIVFICQNGGVSFLDEDYVNAKHKVALKGVQSEGKESAPVDFLIPDSDFRCRGMVYKALEKDDELVVLRLPGRTGETEGQIRDENSRLRDKLSARKGDTGRYSVSFKVYPDSFDVFRRAREIAWAAGFGVGWEPMKTGEQMKYIFRAGAAGGMSIEY